MDSAGDDGKGFTMRVSVYKLSEGRVDVMVEAATGHGKAPVVLQDVDVARLPELLAPVLAAQKGRREEAPLTG